MYLSFMFEKLGWLDGKRFKMRFETIFKSADITRVRQRGCGWLKRPSEFSYEANVQQIMIFSF